MGKSLNLSAGERRGSADNHRYHLSLASLNLFSTFPLPFSYLVHLGIIDKQRIFLGRLRGGREKTKRSYTDYLPTLSTYQIT